MHTQNTQLNIYTKLHTHTHSSSHTHCTHFCVTRLQLETFDLRLFTCIFDVLTDSLAVLALRHPTCFANLTSARWHCESLRSHRWRITCLLRLLQTKDLWSEMLHQWWQRQGNAFRLFGCLADCSQRWGIPDCLTQRIVIFAETFKISGTSSPRRAMATH